VFYILIIIFYYYNSLNLYENSIIEREEKMYLLSCKPNSNSLK